MNEEILFNYLERIATALEQIAEHSSESHKTIVSKSILPCTDEDNNSENDDDEKTKSKNIEPLTDF